MSTLYSGPAVLGVREQAAIVNEMTRVRFDSILPMAMRETGFDMWIIVCHEDNHDPVFNTLIPWQCWAPILQIVVFYDPGPDQAIERLNVSFTNMMGLMTDTWSLQDDQDQWARLREIVETRNPRRIGINESSVIWGADGLTASLKARLVDTLGPELSSRLESAEKLAIRWLETLIPEELDLYGQACAIAHQIIKTCFSRKVITPGKTTCQDVQWAYWQMANDLGLPVSFSPFFRIYRSDENKARWGETDAVIRPGDMLHCDVGVKYLRLLTDHQELAYVLRPGETDAPQGLRDGMAQSNRLQEIFTETWQKGLTGNEILAKALASARSAGLYRPKIYSHSLGYLLHEPGPLMGLPWEQERCPGRGDVMMEYNTAYTVELNTTHPVPEWGGQEVLFPLEQDAAYTEHGVIFLDGRQTSFHLI